MENFNLYDMIVIIKNRKIMIFSTTVLLVAACVSLIYANSNKHLIVATITPGRDVRGGQVFYFESPQILASAIDAGTFASQVREKLGLAKDVSLNVSAKVPFKTKLIAISYKTEDVELGKNIINATIESLTQSYADNYELQIKATTKRIEEKQNRMKALERQKQDLEKTAKEIELKNAQIDNTRERIKLLAAHLDKTTVTRQSVVENTQQLLEKRQQLLKSNSPNSGMDRLLYASVIQGDIRYQASLDKDIRDLQSLTKELEGKIKSLKIGIDKEIIKKEEKLTSIENALEDNLIAIETIKLEQATLVPVQIVQKATDTPAKLPASPILLIFLAVVGGLVGGAALALTLEVLKRQNQEQAA